MAALPLGILFLGAFLPPPAQTPPSAEPPPTSLEWGGAKFEGVLLDEKARTAAAPDAPPAGVLVHAPRPGYYADRTGFQDGDLLLAVDDEALGQDPAAALAAFAKRTQGIHSGQHWKLTLLRPHDEYQATLDGQPLPDPAALFAAPSDPLADHPPGSELKLRVRRTWELLHLDFAMGLQPLMAEALVPATEKLYAGHLFHRLPLRKEILAAEQEAGFDADTQDLFQRLRRLAESADPSRIPAVDLVFRDPWRLSGIAEDFATGFEKGSLGKDPARILASACAHGAWILDLDTGFRRSGPPSPQRRSGPKPGHTPQEHLDFIAARLDEATVLREAALADLDEQERAQVLGAWQGLSDRFVADLYLFNDPQRQRREAEEALVKIAGKVHRDRMLAAAAALAPLLDPAWHRALLADLERADLDLEKAVVLRRDTPQGAIVIAGRGDDWHRSGSTAVLIDLGGDDFYSDEASTTVAADATAGAGVSLLVDLAGDDAYSSTHDGAQACGLLGVGILADLGGNDSYLGLRWAQGVGLCGVGILLDTGGDDRYRALALAQGCAAWGMGLLLDLAGTDSYRGHRFAQGVGLPGGIGVLSEGGGADSYYCKGVYPSGYGTPGIFEGWGQGCGVGFRSNASGGVGLLIDQGGADRYEAGNFSQGGGYFFALGALCDRGRDDDLYIGSRYDQGFCAHQALGYFHESGGDDRYLTRNAVAAGLAWDECVAMFLEDGGDDQYRMSGFSLGASAHNSLCVFWEKGGNDSYRGTAPALAGGNDYHGGTSLSYFLDSGGRDHWADGKQRDGLSSSNGEHGLFVDRP